MKVKFNYLIGNNFPATQGWLIILITILSVICPGCNSIKKNDESNKKIVSSIAYAYPTNPITVDGDLSDWPEDIDLFDINNAYSDSAKNEKDLNAYFQVAYNLKNKLLYVLVVVNDESIVVDTSDNATWYTQDTYSLFLNKKNLQSGSGVVAYQFNNIWKNLVNPSDSWDPEVKNETWDNCKVACKRNDSTTIYEFSIMLGSHIKEGNTIGIDHVILDKDIDDKEHSYTYLTWGDRTDKDNSPGNLGYVILMKPNEPLVTISGQIKWTDTSIVGFPGKIRITSVDNPALWAQVNIDSIGKYTALVPEGTYKVSPVWSFWGFGDELYKIDKENSKIIVKAVDTDFVVALDLIFLTLPPPNLIPERGVLYDFNSSKNVMVDSFVKSYMEFYEIPGVSLALIKDSKLVYHNTYGVTNTYTTEPVNENTIFEAASIGKPVFAFAVCRLIEKGIIELDKPLYQYLEFEDIAHDERYKLITARHVLCHQTGFPNWRYENPDGKLDIKFTPGTDFMYSGEGYGYLKRVIEHITQKEINEVIEQEVFVPLNLKNIYFSENDHLASVVSNGHLDNLPTRARLPRTPVVASSMHTEAKSFTKFILALNSRLGLNTEMYDEMFKIQTVVPLDEKEKEQGLEIFFGLGLTLENTPHGFVYEHGGNNWDFKCQFKMFKDINMGYVIFTNSNTGGKLAYDAITQFLITGKQTQYINAR